MSHSKRRAALATVLVLLAGVLAACSGDSKPEPSVDAFLDGWRSGRLDGVSFLGPNGDSLSAGDVKEQIKKVSGDLPGAPTKLERPPGSVQPLRAMMRQVVTAGTATALSDVPGGPVYGKTGTAEYDNNPEHAHAWWIGWQGDIAFAVFVEGGGHSTSVSVPVAERFLRAVK